jgi:hypothetical protein
MWARIAHNLRTSPTGKAVLQTDKLDAVTDRGYFRSRGDHRDAAQADDLGRAKLEGRFCKQDFVYLREEEVHRCSACERLMFHYVNEEKRAEAARYWTNACGTCAIEYRCTTGEERRITRREGAEASRRSSGHASASRDGRAPFRHAQGADGRDALPDEAAA